MNRELVSRVRSILYGPETVRCLAPHEFRVLEQTVSGLYAEADPDGYARREGQRRLDRNAVDHLTAALPLINGLMRTGYVNDPVRIAKAQAPLCAAAELVEFPESGELDLSVREIWQGDYAGARHRVRGVLARISGLRASALQLVGEAR